MTKTKDMADPITRTEDDIAAATAARDAANEVLLKAQGHLNDLIRQHCKWRIGQIVEQRGKVFKITRISVRYDRPTPYGVQALKNGGYGATERELWSLV